MSVDRKAPDGDGRTDGKHSTAEQRIASFQAATHRAIGEWSDAQLDAVIARLRQDGTSRPERFALLMFLEDARLQRHELRARLYTDGKGSQPNIILP